MRVIKVKITEDGSIAIPKEFLKKFDLRPNEEVLLKDQPNGLITQKIQRSHLDEISQLLKEGLRDVQWAEIERAREDRCF